MCTGLTGGNYCTSLESGKSEKVSFRELDEMLDFHTCWGLTTSSSSLSETLIDIVDDGVFRSGSTVLFFPTASY